MKLKILYIGLAACTSMLSAQPKLALDKNDIDLGIFYSGEVRQGTIRISNIGTDTLKIFSVHPTCGCTTVKQPKEYLLPNQSDEIVVEYNSTGSSGSVHKRVIISTNDPSSPSVDVKLHGEARVDMEQDRSEYVVRRNLHGFDIQQHIGLSKQVRHIPDR